MTGIIDHETGTRDVTRLSGLRKVMMPVAVAGILAAVSSAGVPPSVGFLGKDLVYEATLGMGDSALLLTGLALLTSILILYAGFVAGIKPFFGQLPDQFEKLRLPEFLLWVPPLLLAAMGLVIGIFPGLIDGPLIKPVVDAVGGDGTAVELKLWHGFNTVLLLSAITLGTGTLCYFLLKPSDKKVRAIERFEKLSPKSIFIGMGSWFARFSAAWTSLFQNGFLRSYVTTIIVFLVILVGYSLFSGPRTIAVDWGSLAELTVYEIAIMILMVLSVMFIVGSKSRLNAVVGMGVMGYTICLLFVIYSAPDLAMTQFSIDTLTVILFVLVLARLPKYIEATNYKKKIRDGIISVSFGLLLALISLEVLQEPVDKEVSEFYAENAYKLAQGKNVVNVILVDFRGADTWMELTVLTAAALGVFSLLKLRLKKDERTIND